MKSAHRQRSRMINQEDNVMDTETSWQDILINSLIKSQDIKKLNKNHYAQPNTSIIKSELVAWNDAYAVSMDLTNVTLFYINSNFTSNVVQTKSLYQRIWVSGLWTKYIGQLSLWDVMSQYHKDHSRDIPIGNCTH